LSPSSGSLIFGEQNPTLGEIPVSWQTWDNGSGVVPVISGDVNWGKIQLSSGEEGRSLVYDLGMIEQRLITITENRYGTGQGIAVLQYRCSDTVFLPTDNVLSWTNYTGIFSSIFRFIQVRATK
jgi:hypothetical protein